MRTPIPTRDEYMDFVKMQHMLK
jgi:hypothetical protein